MKVIISRSEKETIGFGRKLGGILRPGGIIALCGAFGTGKTVLTKGIAKGLGVRHAKYVNSPSYVILKEYKGRLPLYHFDVYRVNDTSEFSTVGYSEYFYGKGVSVVEWADKVIELLPQEFLKIEMSFAGENGRKIRVSSRAPRYKKLIKKL